MFHYVTNLCRISNQPKILINKRVTSNIPYNAPSLCPIFNLYEYFINIQMSHPPYSLIALRLVL